MWPFKKIVQLTQTATLPSNVPQVKPPTSTSFRLNLRDFTLDSHKFRCTKFMFKAIPVDIDGLLPQDEGKQHGGLISRSMLLNLYNFLVSWSDKIYNKPIEPNKKAFKIIKVTIDLTMYNVLVENFERLQMSSGQQEAFALLTTLSGDFAQTKMTLTIDE